MFFQLSPSGRSKKNAFEFYNATILFFKAAKRGETKKTALLNFPIGFYKHGFGFYHFRWAFGWSFPSSAKRWGNEGRRIPFKTRFFNFPHRGEAKKHPWDRILQFRFHATILGGLFQAAQNAGVTKDVEFRSKRVFSTFPIGAKRKNSLFEFYNFGFMPAGWAFPSSRGSRKWSNCVPTRFVKFPHRGETKKRLLIGFYNFGFMPHFGWAFPSSAKRWGNEGVEFRSKAFFQLSPIGAKRKNTLSNFTISVSCHHFGWAFPSSGKPG